eukprot:COSAG01_NODE_513_length_16049_cov_57.758056_7_plen_88_part_00
MYLLHRRPPHIAAHTQPACCWWREVADQQTWARVQTAVEADRRQSPLPLRSAYSNTTVGNFLLGATRNSYCIWGGPRYRCCLVRTAY